MGREGKEAMQLARNLIRVGQVNSVDPGKGTVRVLFEDKDNLISDDIPLLNFEYNMPKVGDQVLCVFLGNGLDQGFCLGSFYSEISPPPANNKDIFMKKLDEDTKIEYNKQTKSLKVTTKEVQIYVQDGKVTVKADEILLGDGAEEGVPLGIHLK